MYGVRPQQAATGAPEQKLAKHPSYIYGVRPPACVYRRRKKVAKPPSYIYGVRPPAFVYRRRKETAYNASVSLRCSSKNLRLPPRKKRHRMPSMNQSFVKSRRSAKVAHGEGPNSVSDIFQSEIQFAVKIVKSIRVQITKKWPAHLLSRTGTLDTSPRKLNREQTNFRPILHTSQTNARAERF